MPGAFENESLNDKEKISPVNSERKTINRQEFLDQMREHMVSDVDVQSSRKSSRQINMPMSNYGEEITSPNRSG